MGRIRFTGSALMTSCCATCSATEVAQPLVVAEAPDGTYLSFMTTLATKGEAFSWNSLQLAPQAKSLCKKTKLEPACVIGQASPILSAQPVWDWHLRGGRIRLKNLPRRWLGVLSSDTRGCVADLFGEVLTNNYAF